MNTNSYPVVIIGGGQAGLAMSWSLTQKNIRHIVLERHRLAWAWREQRWDNFCLVTPNWQCKLPGFPYDGDDPHGFMLRDDIVAYLERYARSFNAPLREGVNVQRVVKRDSRFTLFTSLGELQADQVVVAVGNYHRPRFPELAARLPERIVQIHSAHYKSAQQMPEGEVLVVGSAQSGAQIAEDLHLAGRQVHLCVGSAPRVARFYRGRVAQQGIDAPVEARYQAPWQPDGPAEPIDLAAISAIIWAVGFHTDFSWIEVPAFDEKGYPRHQRGVSVEAGLYFLGLPWLWTWGSGRFEGVGDDALWQAEIIARRAGHIAAQEAVDANSAE